MDLSPFHLHLDVLALVAVLEGAYLWAVLRLGPSAVPEGQEPVGRRQILWFSSGALTYDPSI